MKVELVGNTNDPEQAIAKAARISHKATGEGLEDDRRLIRNLIEWGHMSPLEFATATFYLEGISRSCLAQLTRHRMASFMVRSMRYVKQDPEETVYPPTIEGSNKKELFKDSVEKAHETYKELLDAGVPKEDARFVLPIGAKTDLYIKANFREYRHIIEIRHTEEAQWEIRSLASEMLEDLHEIAPSAFTDLLDNSRK